jgi:hypothetical protein
MTLATVRALRRSGRVGGRPAPVTAAHPFAEFLRTIGRGATLGRPLDETEAEQAMGMILDGAVEPVQAGRFFWCCATAPRRRPSSRASCAPRGCAVL